MLNDALRLKVEHDRRIAALASFVDHYEREHGEIAAEEMQSTVRRARAGAVSTRVHPTPKRKRGARGK